MPLYVFRIRSASGALGVGFIIINSPAQEDLVGTLPE